MITVVFSSCGNTEVESINKVVKNDPKIEVKKDYNYYLKRIAEDEEWMVSIEDKAKKLGTSVDEELSNNAKHMAKENGFGEEIKDYDYYLKRISEDSVWMIDVKNQAAEKGISVDSALIRNAKHMASGLN